MSIDPGLMRAGRIASALLIGLALAGCGPDPAAATCRADCELSILLPEDPALPPQVPGALRVAGGRVLRIAVRGRRPEQARSVVAFDQAAFENAEGEPQYSVELLPGRNPLRLRSYAAGVCHAPGGCRYLIVNAGLARRPAVTSAVGVLIIDPDTGSD